LPYYIFADMKAWDAMETSRKIVGKNFGTVLGFGIVLGLVTGLGYFMCCIGILATIPIAQISIYSAFKDMMQLDVPLSEDDDILDHLVD